MLKNGYIYIAQPPLYRVDIGKEHYYLKDDAVLRDFDAADEGRKYEVLRFKGLGEMDWEELKVTTMDPRRGTCSRCRSRTLPSPTTSSPS